MKSTPKVLVGKALPNTTELVNVCVVTADAGYCHSQCWDGTKAALETIRLKVAMGKDDTRKWDFPVIAVFCSIPSRNETYSYTAKNLSKLS